MIIFQINILNMPPDDWDLIPAKERVADSITTFILFCEDKVNEPTYFHSFQKDKKVKINFVEDQKSDYTNYLNTINYCIDNGLMQANAGGYQLTPDVTQNICVFMTEMQKYKISAG